MYQNQPQVVGAKAAEQPILIDCYKRITSHINHAHEAATRIENVIDRLLNPTPRPAQDAAPKPQPQTIEALLNDADSIADGLAQRLHELATRLERAA